MTDEELRAFEHYRLRPAVALGGVTIDSDEFWGNIVLKLATTEPAVLYAVLALSTLHKTASAMPGIVSQHEAIQNCFAFDEYGKAIKAVRQWDTNNISKQGVAITLLVCVLFICIEFLMDYDGAAQLHICHGRLILSRIGWMFDSSPTMEMIRKVLVPIYARLSLVSYFLGTRPEAIPVQLALGQDELPIVFTTMKEARDRLYYIIDNSLRFISKAKQALFDTRTEAWEMHVYKTEQDHLLAQLAKWNSAFTRLKTAQVTESTASKAMKELIYVFFHTSKIWLGCALMSRETAYDDYETDFAAIINHAASMLATSGSLSEEHRAFTFETEMLAPVYWVTSKCRHPMIRRAALRLLSQDRGRRSQENIFGILVSLLWLRLGLLRWKKVPYQTFRATKMKSWPERRQIATGTSSYVFQ